MMTIHVTRRGVITGTGCLCGGAVLASRMSQPVFVDEKWSVWPVTCRDAIFGSIGQKDCWSALRAVGAEGVEVQVIEDMTLPSLFHPTVKYSQTTTTGVEQFAADAKAAGQRITAFSMANRFEERPTFEIKWCSELARVAQTLGVRTIRIDVVPVNSAWPESLKLSIKALKKVMAASESTGVAFAIEIHGNTTNNPDFLNAIFERVGSNRLGLTLDACNFYWFGHPLSKVHEFAEEFAPRVFHVHCKSICYPVAEREKAASDGLEIRGICEFDRSRRHQLRPHCSEPT